MKKIFMKFCNCSCKLPILQNMVLWGAIGLCVSIVFMSIKAIDESPSRITAHEPISTVLNFLLSFGLLLSVYFDCYSIFFLMGYKGPAGTALDSYEKIYIFVSTNLLFTIPSYMLIGLFISLAAKKSEYFYYPAALSVYSGFIVYLIFICIH